MSKWIRRAKKAARDPHRILPFVSTQVAKPYLSTVLAISSRYPLGEHVFSHQWDVLILLDTCRVDALKTVAPEYDFISTVDSIWSVGGASSEWIASTFNKQWTDEIKNTAYLASNGFAKRVLEERIRPGDNHSLSRWADWDPVVPKKMGRIEHLWKYELKDEQGKLGHREGHSPPDYVTDRGVAVGREYDFERLILHYNQPHSPYTYNALEEDRELLEYERNPFKYLKCGGDRDRIWNTYIDDLRYVLDYVELLLSNIDAGSVVISADHGEAFGEFGAYGHKVGSLNPYIRQVPWVKTTAVDEKTYEPQFDPITAMERSVEDTLEALGYKL